MKSATIEKTPVVATLPEGFDTTILRTVKISTTISKLGHTIPSINLPPIVTCRANAPCIHGCYATRGNWLYKNSREAVWNNLYAFMQSPKLFFDTVACFTANYKFVRWFSSGDMANVEFFQGMIRVAKKNKGTTYLCFTKKYEIVNEYLDSGKRIPSNLKIVFSAWPGFIPDNPYNLPMTYVRLSEKAKKKVEREEAIKYNAVIPQSAFPCGGSCANCTACWQLKKGQSVMFKKH